MAAWCLKIVFPVLIILILKGCKGQENGVTTWRGAWKISPTTSTAISLQTSLPRTLNSVLDYYLYDDYEEEEEERDEPGVEELEIENPDDLSVEGRKKFHYKKHHKKKYKKKKFKKFLLPLLVAYKLKFFTLIPVLIGGLVLLTGATGLAGFFFALFAATMGLKTGGYHSHHK